MHSFLFVILLFTPFALFSQQATTASGGSSTGTGGSSEFSIGQPVYLNYSNDSWQISEGVQQPFEIYQLNSLSENIEITISIGPNPSSDQLTVFVQSEDSNGLFFKLFDINGKELMNGELSVPYHQFDLKNLALATYTLTLSQNQQLVKTFKLIKNN